MPEPLPELPESLLIRLRARHAEPQRHYHAQAHIDALLRWLDVHRSLANEPRLMEAAEVGEKIAPVVVDPSLAGR